MTRLALAPLIAVCLLRATPAAATPVSLTTSGQFQVQWKGKIEPGARIYRSNTPPTVLLVTTAAFSRPIFITIAPTSARLLDPARVTTTRPIPRRCASIPAGRSRTSSDSNPMAPT